MVVLERQKGRKKKQFRQTFSGKDREGLQEKGRKRRRSQDRRTLNLFLQGERNYDAKEIWGGATQWKMENESLGRPAGARDIHRCEGISVEKRIKSDAVGKRMSHGDPNYCQQGIRRLADGREEKRIQL